jgi:pimeloyl-ACP methyl ester carboxylesterase
VARVGDRIAFTRIDRFVIGGLVVTAAAVAGVLYLSQAIVAPPRPRISESKRPTIGLALRSDGAVLRVVRAAGPSKDAGLRTGDRVISVDGEPVRTVEDVVTRVAAAVDGQGIKIDARRGRLGRDEVGVLADVKVTLKDVSPADFGLPYEDVAFRNADGLNLRGWYLPPPPVGAERAPAIAYGHGNATDRRQWLPVALAVHDAGFAQLLFDFTGRGESEGEVISLGAHEAQDLRSALDVLAARPEIDPMRLAVGGRSMGAAAAIYLAADDARVKALVLDSPFADLKELVHRAIASHHIPSFLLGPPLLGVVGWRAHYEPRTVRPIDAIRKVKTPTLLFHGTKDTLIPYDDAKALKAAAMGPVTLVPLEGLDHNTPRPASYQDRIVTFLTHTLPPAWRTP